jgi:hypothetical protein
VLLGWTCSCGLGSGGHHYTEKVKKEARRSSSLRNRDGKLGTGTRYPPGTRPNGVGYGDDFLPVGGTRIRPEPRQVRGGYFFPPMGNPIGTRYFITVMILGCEQVKMCLFCDINYDLF